MSAVVLVHGAWHWGGCWAPVQAILEQAGHTVYAPSLALNRGSTLATHIEQVVDLIREQQLEQIVLVGHSYGGAVISGVLARLPGRVHHAVFLDAILPEPGRRLIDLLLPAAGIVTLQGLLRLQPMWPSFVSAEGFGVRDRRDAAWIDGHLRPHPAATLFERFPYSADFDPARCTYVACAEPIRISGEESLLGKVMERFMPASPLAGFRQRAGALGWKVVELPVGHDVMVIAPREVAALIRAVAPPVSAPPVRERAVGA